MTKNREALRRQLLERLLSGEINPTGDKGRRLLQDDPDLRASFEELQVVGELLDSTAADDEERMLAIPHDGEDARRALDTLQAIWDEEGGEAQRRPMPVIWMSLAVGVLLAVILGASFFVGDGPSDRLDPYELGSGQLRCTAPVGDVEQYSEFTWKCDLPASYQFHLVVLSQDSGEIVDSEGQLRGTTWTMPPERARALPDRIRWFVSARMPGSEEALRGIEVEAQRRDR